MKAKEKIHFPNLDGLRFIGSMIILLFHMEDIKQRHGQEASGLILSYGPIGELDVSLFFVLSGFLITFLLLREKQDTGTIVLKNFYVRRILKIWPLYYFIMIIGFFLLPYFGHAFYPEYSKNLSDHFPIALIGYLFFLPPLLLGGYRLPDSMGATWTVIVEEAFYLFWPFIVRRSKNFIKVICIIIVSVIFIRDAFIVLHYLLRADPYYEVRLTTVIELLGEYRFSCMAIGGVAAYIFITKQESLLQFLFKKNLQLLVYITLFLMMMLHVKIPLMNQEFYSVLFAYIVLNMAVNPASIVKLNYTWMSYLGSLSYGIYLYHPIMRILSLETITHVFNRNISGWQMELSFYSLTIGSTLLVAMLSYRLMEKPFLNLKKKFSFVNS
jgi:peptidoglycan/LPS O-acetylase OafA/YrhL